MKDRIRAFFASIVLIIYLTDFSGVFASVLGTEQVFSGRTQIAGGTYYNENVFYSDQQGVGLQSEYYFEYSPNDSVIPVISNGEAVYGRYNIFEAYNTLTDSEKNPVAGINGDFYSLQTGVPISHCISDGYIITKDHEIQPAVGFLPDGTAFVGDIGIELSVTKGDKSVIVENINKYRQPYTAYIFTEDFGPETHDRNPGLVVVLTDVSDKLSVEGTVTAAVESVDYYEGSVAIPEGKLIVSIDDHLKEQENYKFFEELAIGDEIELTTTLTGDQRFLEAVSVMGGSQGQLIKDGVINEELDDDAAPRTAIGVKEDGSTIFYTIDGRQKNHSYGVRVKTLSKRMAELGCVDAILLDGGGSTTCALVMPGYSDFTVANKPSDGSPRKNANYLFLLNNEKPTNEPYNMHIYPLDMKLLSGAASSVVARMTDKGFYPVESQDIEYEISMGDIQSDGSFSVTGNGEFTITASYGKIKDSISYFVYDNPTGIAFKKNGSNVAAVSLNPGESVQLDAVAKYNNAELVSRNDLFLWKVSDKRIGSVTDDGVFTAGNVKGDAGEVIVSYGDVSQRLKIKINGDKASPENYHTIDNFFYDGKMIKADISNTLGVKAESIMLKIDREEVEAAFDNGVLTFNCPEGFSLDTHRIFISVQNEFGNKTVAYFEAKGDGEIQNKFTDIDGNWAFDIILFMNKNGVINGYTEDNGNLVFKPSDSMTRSQFAVMVSNYLRVDLDEYEEIELPFTDVEQLPQWALPQIKAMYSLNVISGRQGEDGVYFDPNANLTRAEAATILSRILPTGILKAEITFEDNEDIPQWAVDGISQLVAIKALNGYEDNTILPQKNITRAECAKLLYSIF